ncbi:MAG: hypothetical protein N2V73_07150 [Candidatus Methanospirare jalkutatii]|nr:hypothetical protein [Candidatus Methanospirare jalkutatii]
MRTYESYGFNSEGIPLEKRKIGVERIKFVRMKLRRGGNNV